MEIELCDISYYSTYLDKNLLNNLNLKFEKGKINGIIGSNGSGKTCLLNIVIGSLTPTKGKIVADSEQITNSFSFNNVNELKRKIGYVSQIPEDKFFKHTVFDHLMDVLDGYNYTNKMKLKRIESALTMLDFDQSYLNRDPDTLSSIEKRKLSIISVLIFNPKVLLFDEPTAGLDNKTKTDILKLIKKLRVRYHKTIIIASNDINSLHKIVDYLFVLQDGNLVLQGDKYFVFGQEQLLENFGVAVPDIISFSNNALEAKKIKMGYRDDINDLIKDIYRFVK